MIFGMCGLFLVVEIVFRIVMMVVLFSKFVRNFEVIFFFFVLCWFMISYGL